MSPTTISDVWICTTSLLRRTPIEMSWTSSYVSTRNSSEIQHPAVKLWWGLLVRYPICIQIDEICI